MKSSILQQEKFHCCSRGDGDLPLLGYGIFQRYYTKKKAKQVLLHKLKEKLQRLAFFTNHHMIIQQVVQLALYLLNIQVLTQTID